MRDTLFNGKLDIFTLNINRGRDHGLDSYVNYRWAGWKWFLLPYNYFIWMSWDVHLLAYVNIKSSGLARHRVESVSATLCYPPCLTLGIPWLVLRILWHALGIPSVVLSILRLKPSQHFYGISPMDDLSTHAALKVISESVLWAFLYFRKHYGLSVPTSFDDLSATHPADAVEALRSIYSDVRDVELYPGGKNLSPVFLGSCPLTELRLSA